SGPLLAAASSLSSRLCNAGDTDQIAEPTGGDGRTGSPQPGAHRVRVVRQSARNASPAPPNPPSGPRVPATQLPGPHAGPAGARGPPEDQLRAVRPAIARVAP